MTKVFPARDLPGDADDWGRYVENVIVSEEGALQQIRQTLNNRLRFTGGQTSSVATRLDELYLRRTIRQSLPNLSVTGAGTIEPYPRATQNFSFSAPSGGRVARFEIYCKNDRSTNANVFAYVSYEGNIISRLTWEADMDAVQDFSNTKYNGSGLAYVVLPESGVSNFSLTIVRVGFVAGSGTETLTDIEAYLTPYQSTT